MLNRRHLRVKVLQSLYAYFQSGNNSLADGERELIVGVEKIYDMYLYQLSLLVELHHQEFLSHHDNKAKLLPSPEDLNPPMHILDNAYLNLLSQNQELAVECKNRKIGWGNNQELVRKLLAQVKDRQYYKKYISEPAGNIQKDLDFFVKLMMKDVVNFELLHSFYEDNSIYWIDDWELVNLMIVKSLKSIDVNNDPVYQLLKVFKEIDDKVFAIDLFRKTILKGNGFDTIISENAKNWEMDRIAIMDIIIIKMGLIEITTFANIPLKASLNEYIELAKMYSSPKSRVFVNGMLDKLAIELADDSVVKWKTSEK
jgi:N utilization substance protein B